MISSLLERTRLRSVDIALKSLVILACLHWLSACGTEKKNGGIIDSYPPTDPDTGPAAGYSGNACGIPAEGALKDISRPDHVIGSGTPESCREADLRAAVAKGGVITFDCGPNPITLVLSQTAKVFNDAADDIVIDGGGKVTLSGGGQRRILYMNTCDSLQHWTSSHCQDQETPRLALQNLTFIDGNSQSETKYDGGGAIWVRGGQFKVIHCRFFHNVCASEGADLGGGAIRVFSQYQNRPVYVVQSTFGGADGYGNTGSNGGGISSIGVSWTIINSLFSHNSAIGHGGNPAQSGTPGGGSGGAIYNDGNTMTLSVCGTLIEHNEVNAFGSGIFFVTNDHSGDIVIDRTTLRDNVGGSWYALPGISMHEDTRRRVVESVLE